MKSDYTKVFYTKIRLGENQIDHLISSLPTHQTQVNMTGLREDNPERDAAVKGFLRNLLTLPIDSKVEMTKKKESTEFSFNMNNKEMSISFTQNESKTSYDVISFFLKANNIVKFNYMLIDCFDVNILSF